MKLNTIKNNKNFFYYFEENKFFGNRNSIYRKTSYI